MYIITVYLVWLRFIYFLFKTGWFGTFGLFFHSVGNVIIPTDFHSIIFQRGRAKNHQHPLASQLLWIILRAPYNDGAYFALKKPIKTTPAARNSCKLLVSLGWTSSLLRDFMWFPIIVHRFLGFSNCFSTCFCRNAPSAGSSERRPATGRGHSCGGWIGAGHGMVGIHGRHSLVI